MTLSGQDVVRHTLESNSNIVEVEVEYRKGNKAKYNLLPGNSSSRQAQIDRLLEIVRWEKVEEVEIEYVDGYKEEIDLEAKLDVKHKSKSESTTPEETVVATVTEAAVEEVAAEEETKEEEPIADVPVVETESVSEPTASVAQEEIAHPPVKIVSNSAHTAAPGPEPVAAPASAPMLPSPDAAYNRASLTQPRRRRSRQALRKPPLRRKSRLRKKNRSIARSRGTSRPLSAKKVVGMKRTARKSSRRGIPSKALLFI